MKKLTSIITVCVLISQLLFVNAGGVAAKSGGVISEELIQKYGDSNGYEHFLMNKAYEPAVGESIVLSVDNAQKTDNSYLWSFNSEAAGRYDIKLAYKVDSKVLAKIECSLLLNGALPYTELSSFVLQREYVDATKVKTDIYGNEMKPEQANLARRIENFIYDYAGLFEKPLSVNIEKGLNSIEFKFGNKDLEIYELILAPSDSEICYSEYYALNKDKNEYKGKVIIYEAENAKQKSDTTLYATDDRSDSGVSPVSSNLILLNTIGGSGWKYANQYIEWVIKAPEDGLYTLTLKAKQNINSGQAVNRMLFVNGEIPFKEARYITVPYDTGWQNITVGNEKGAYKIYLKKGENTIRLQASLGESDRLIRAVDNSVSALNMLYRRLLVVLGSEPDTLRDYKLDKIMPDVIAELGEQAKILEGYADQLEKANGGGNSGIALMRTLIRQLKEMNEDSEEIVKQFSYFKTNIGSLGTWQSTVKEQPLRIDCFMLGGEQELPKANSGFFSNTWFSLKKFISSFVTDYTNIGALEETNSDILKAWISSGRDQSQIIRTLISDEFTYKTGTRVKLELVSAASLLPATVAGIGPDVYIGATDVVNYAMRNAAYDVSRFSDFGEVSKRFEEQMFVPLRYNGGTYGLPYSATFMMLFYRTDILEELDAKSPETWNDVIALSSVLAKNSMEFGLPNGYQIFVMMLKQKGIDIYAENGKECLLDSVDAIELFSYYTSFYENYGFPLTYNFVNRFRTGEMPIAVAELENYNTLQISAPEINGLWKMTSVPGFGSENNERLSIVTPKAVMLLKNTKLPNEAWEFMKWWTSDETQVRYGNEIESVLGKSGRYISSNTNAFSQSLWSSEEKEIIGTQMSNLCALEQVPGGYYLSRHLNNAFRNVVFKSKKPMDMMFDYVYKINSEIREKRAEFGLE